MAYLNGHVGQIKKTFSANEDIIALIKTKHSITDFAGLIQLGIQAPTDTEVMINNQSIYIGSTGIYELENFVNIKKLSFTAETTAIVDYIY